MKALVIGATGAVGQDLVEQLIEDEGFSQVHVFVRRAMGKVSDKLVEHIVDFDDMSAWQEELQGDVLFSCLGTTLKDAGSKQAQWKVDYEYQFQAAKAAAENKVARYVLVSSLGANQQSPVFYLKLKGALDEAVKALAFKYKGIVRPASLIRKNTTRPLEKPAIVLVKLLNTVGLFRSNKPIKTETVAAAMINMAKSETVGYEVVTGPEIFPAALSTRNAESKEL